MRFGVVRIQSQTDTGFANSWLGPAFAQQRVRQVVMSLRIIGFQLQRSVEVCDCAIDVPCFKQLAREIVFRHPTAGISLDGGSPQCLDIGITPALAPGQCAKHGANQNAECPLAKFQRVA